MFLVTDRKPKRDIVIIVIGIATMMTLANPFWIPFYWLAVFIMLKWLVIWAMN